MYAFLLMLLSAAPVNAPPARLPHAWMKVGNSQKLIGGVPTTIHHFADMSSASISPENGFRRIWLKDEWHPPLWKASPNATAFLAELVEMDCTGHRSRNIAYEEYELGFMDASKDADWDPIRAGSLQDGLCQLPAANFVSRH